MELTLLENDKTYTFECDNQLSIEQLTDISIALNKYGDCEVEFKGQEEAREQVKYNFVKALENTGIRKINSPYYQITYIPANECEKKVLDEKKVLALLNELGLDIDDYYITKKNSRKASIRFGEK